MVPDSLAPRMPVPSESPSPASPSPIVGEGLGRGGNLRPRLALGLGCDRGTPEATLREAIAQALAQLGADWADVAAIASITLKADEVGLLALCAAQGWAPQFYPPEQLAQVAVPNPSETVRRYTGTPSVSEAAALLAAGCPHDMHALRVEKHRLKGVDGRHATVSIASGGDGVALLGATPFDFAQGADAGRRWLSEVALAERSRSQLPHVKAIPPRHPPTPKPTFNTPEPP